MKQKQRAAVRSVIGIGILAALFVVRLCECGLGMSALVMLAGAALTAAGTAVILHKRDEF